MLVALANFSYPLHFLHLHNDHGEEGQQKHTIASAAIPAASSTDSILAAGKTDTSTACAMSGLKVASLKLCIHKIKTACLLALPQHQHTSFNCPDVSDRIALSFFKELLNKRAARLFKSSLKKDRAILSETSGQLKLVCWC